MRSKEYNRKKAIEYAAKWVYKRNPKYYNFDSVGGDCTSYISQCIYAGAGIMNYKKHIGWYYNSPTDRTASWSGVEYLYDFLTKNKGIGPRAKVASIEKLEIGDIIQLKFLKERFSHSLIIVDKKKNSLEDIYVATHTEDTYYRKVSTYIFEDIRFLHITDIGI
jgi:hypothetical protein